MSTTLPASRTLVTGGRILQGQDLVWADLEIVDGIITQIARQGDSPLLPREGDVLLDATDRLVFPGFVNAHYHSHDVLARGLMEEEYLESWITRVLPPSYPPRTTEEVEIRTLLGALDSIKGGVTTVQDMVTLSPFDPIQLRAVATAYDKAGVRAAVGVQYADVAGAKVRPLQMQALPESQRANVVSAAEPDSGDVLAAIADTCFSFPAPGHGLVDWVLAPTAPESCSDALLERTMQVARDHGVSVFTHVNESKTRAVEAKTLYPEYGGSIVNRMQKVGIVGTDVNIAHGVWFTESELELLAETGTGVVLNVMSNLKLKSGVPPINRYRELGIRVALGTDNLSCSDTVNMFQAMKLTALLAAASRHERGPAPSRFVLEAATVGGARAVGRGDERGVLAVGTAGDLFTVDATDTSWIPLNDAVRQLVYSEGGRGVREVVVNGVVVLRDGRSTLIDEDELRLRTLELAAHYRRDFEDVSSRMEAMRPGLDKAHELAAASDIGFDRLI